MNKKGEVRATPEISVAPMIDQANYRLLGGVYVKNGEIGFAPLSWFPNGVVAPDYPDGITDVKQIGVKHDDLKPKND